ncbi:MAG: hypothetical protein Q9190_002928 [Brigantiaea leucoxantha]
MDSSGDDDMSWQPTSPNVVTHFSPSTFHSLKRSFDQVDSDEQDLTPQYHGPLLFDLDLNTTTTVTSLNYSVNQPPLILTEADLRYIENSQHLSTRMIQVVLTSGLFLITASAALVGHVWQRAKNSWLVKRTFDVSVQAMDNGAKRVRLQFQNLSAGKSAPRRTSDRLRLRGSSPPASQTSLLHKTREASLRRTKNTIRWMQNQDFIVDSMQQTESIMDVASEDPDSTAFIPLMSGAIQDEELSEQEELLAESQLIDQMEYELEDQDMVFVCSEPSELSDSFTPAVVVESSKPDGVPSGAAAPSHEDSDDSVDSREFDDLDPRDIALLETREEKVERKRLKMEVKVERAQCKSPKIYNSAYVHCDFVNDLQVTNDIIKSKGSPKKNVAFYNSPNTGMPVTQVKEFLVEDSMEGNSSIIQASASMLSDSEASPSARSTANHVTPGAPKEQLTESSKVESLPDEVISMESTSGLALEDTEKTPVGNESIVNPDHVSAQHEKLPNSHSSEGDSLSFAKDSVSESPYIQPPVTKEDVASAIPAETQRLPCSEIFVEPSLLRFPPPEVEGAVMSPVKLQQVEQLPIRKLEKGVSLRPRSPSGTTKSDRKSADVTKLSPRTPIKKGRQSLKSTSETPDTVTPRTRVLDVANRRSSDRQSNKNIRLQIERELRAAEQAKKDEKAAKEAAKARAKAEKEKAEADERARKASEENLLRDKLRTRRMPKEKVIQPLNAEWEAKVKHAMRPGLGREEAKTVEGSVLYRRDFGFCLPQPGQDNALGWLNDNMIFAYLQTIAWYARETAGGKRTETKTAHAFDQNFYNKLKADGPQGVARWSKRAKIGGKDLLKVHHVFIPINKGGNHWVLAYVSPFARTIEYFDSFHGRSDDAIANIQEWLKMEFGSTYKEDEWIVKDRGGPTQTNGSDCGVFAVTVAKMIVMGVDPMAFSHVDIPTQRRRMIAELINQGFTGDFEPKIEF